MYPCKACGHNHSDGISTVGACDVSGCGCPAHVDYSDAWLDTNACPVCGKTARQLRDVDALDFAESADPWCKRCDALLEEGQIAPGGAA